MRFDRLFPIVFISSLVVICYLIVYSMAVFGNAKEICLKNGYPNVTTTYSSEAYCIKRLDQTDIVVPVSELTGGKNDR